MARLAPLLLLLLLLSRLHSSAPASSPFSRLIRNNNGTTTSPPPPPNEGEESSSSTEAPPPFPSGLKSFTNGNGAYKGMGREFVTEHNKIRARYGLEPMKWNKKLARYARRWANAMRKDCVVKHSDTGKVGYGESVFVAPRGWNWTATDAVGHWATEEPIYDKETGQCTEGLEYDECGHFALIVNKEATRIGCGRGECFRGGVFISCNYYFEESKK